MGRPVKDDLATLSTNIESFAHALRTTLKARGLPLRVVARSINASDSAISRWQCGKDVPGADQLAVLCEQLGVHGAERERLESLREAAEQDKIASRRNVSSAETPLVGRPPARRWPRRLPWLVGAASAAVICAVVIGWIAMSAGPATPPQSGSAATQQGDTDTTTVSPVIGGPVYTQCSDRDRSMLSAPGSTRGGEHRGTIRPGQEFVVTGETLRWKRGYLKDDPDKRIVFVMSSYLSRTKRHC